jgi:hypothetical protein
MPYSCHIVAMARFRTFSPATFDRSEYPDERGPSAPSSRKVLTDRLFRDRGADDVQSESPFPQRPEDFSFGWWAQLR